MAETAKFRSSSLDELERNFPGISSTVRGLPGRALETATTVPRAAAAVGMRAIQDRTLPLVAGVNMATEALTPVVGDAMAAGQTDLGFPPEAMAEARRTQQLLNPGGTGVVAETIAPKAAAAVPAVISGLRTLGSPVPSAPDTARRLEFGPASTDTARRLNFGPAETPFFTNIPRVAEARGLRERADLPGVFGNIQGDFGQRGGGVSFANMATSPSAASSAGIRQPAQPIQAAELLKNISAEDLTPAGIAAAANLQAASERGIRQRIRDEQTAVEEARKQGEALTAAENAEINRQNMLINRQKSLIDLAKGIRELESPAVELETVKSTDPKTGIVSEQSFVRTPQGLVPFNDYQIATRVEAADLEGARSAIAQGRDRAGVLAKLQAKYPGIDFNSL